LGLEKDESDKLPDKSPLRHKPCEFDNYGQISDSSYIHERDKWVNVQRIVSLDSLRDAVKSRMIKLYSDLYNNVAFSNWNGD